MTKSTTDRRAPETTVSILALHRGQLIAVAVIGIILGLIGLIFPTEALLFIAIIFGVYLIVAGIFRINFALTAHDLHTGIRWLAALLGLLIVATGVLCLADPFSALLVLAYVIGIGWIASGISDIVNAIQGATRFRWLGWLSGIVGILAGIVVFILPAAGITVFLLVGSILLIAVSIASLLTMPGKHKPVE